MAKQVKSKAAGSVTIDPGPKYAAALTRGLELEEQLRVARLKLDEKCAELRRLRLDPEKSARAAARAMVVAPDGEPEVKVAPPGPGTKEALEDIRRHEEAIQVLEEAVFLQDKYTRKLREVRRKELEVEVMPRVQELAREFVATMEKLNGLFESVEEMVRGFEEIRMTAPSQVTALYPTPLRRPGRADRETEGGLLWHYLQSLKANGVVLK